MRSFLLLLVSVTGFTVHAQKFFNRSGVIKNALYENGSYLKLNMLSIADLPLPTLQPGYEYKHDHLGFEVALGIPLGNLWSKRNTDSTFYHYYKVRATIKYYSRKNSYVGFESFFVHTHYNRYYYNYILQNKGYYQSEYTVNNKSVVGFDIKFGKAIELGNKFYMENFAGVGFRIVTIKQPVNINPIQGYPPNYAFSFQDIIGTKYTPHLTFGMELVYKL